MHSGTNTTTCNAKHNHRRCIHTFTLINLTSKDLFVNQTWALSWFFHRRFPRSQTLTASTMHNSKLLMRWLKNGPPKGIQNHGKRWRRKCNIVPLIIFSYITSLLFGLNFSVLKTNKVKPSQGNPQDVFFFVQSESMFPAPEVKTNMCVIFALLTLVHDTVFICSFVSS